MAQPKRFSGIWRSWIPPTTSISDGAQLIHRIVCNASADGVPMMSLQYVIGRFGKLFAFRLPWDRLGAANTGGPARIRNRVDLRGGWTANIQKLVAG
jgi:hypothetical protein